MGLEQFEYTRPGDLSDEQKLPEDIANRLGNAQALILRAREVQKKDVNAGFPEDAKLLEESARDVEAAITDVRLHLRDGEKREHLALALSELDYCYHDLLTTLESDKPPTEH